MKDLQETAAPPAGERLRRELRPRHLRMIALGGIIGASLFVGSGAVINTVGPAAVLSYVIGGLMVVFVMRMLGEMAAAQPTLGSFMEYARASLGGWAGFTTGWLYWYYWVGIVAFEAVVGAQILQKWMPDVPQWTFALILMVVLTATNLVSVRSFGEAEYWLASVKVACITVFLLVGTLYVIGLWPDSTGSVTHIANDGFFAHGGFAVIHGVVIVVFSYFGAEIVTIAASESKEPAKAIATATVTVIWRVLLFFVGSVTLLVMITPWDEVPHDGTSPFAAAFDRFGIPAAETIMNIVVLTAVVSVLNSGLYIASRMLFAMREHGWAPNWVGDTSRRGVPWKGILLSTALGYVAVIMSFVSPDRIFYFIINSAGAVALFLYGIIALSQLRMRDRLERTAPDRLKLKMWLHPWLSWATFVCVVLVLISMGVVDDTRSQLWLSLISLAAFLAVYAAITWRARRAGAAER
ncbi:amino acid permease [Spirillospora sp. NPDC029432]|uniref:amino acid permease n=1 Tax=Spirillospora sp. NPDC029432 TaxID=3154599 RepID=UPI003455AFEF